MCTSTEHLMTNLSPKHLQIAVSRLCDVLSTGLTIYTITCCGIWGPGRQACSMCIPWPCRHHGPGASWNQHGCSYSHLYGCTPHVSLPQLEIENVHQQTDSSRPWCDCCPASGGGAAAAAAAAARNVSQGLPSSLFHWVLLRSNPSPAA